MGGLVAALGTRHSFGDTKSLEKIEEFVVWAGRKPVYIGWGSVIFISPEYMVQFVVLALRHSGLRGIVQGGSACLSMELLRQATTDVELIAYAEKNVLFVGAVPHEW